MVKNEREKNHLKELYAKFKSFNLQNLDLIDKIYQSIVEGKIAEENKEFFESITMRYVDGIICL